MDDEEHSGDSNEESSEDEGMYDEDQEMNDLLSNVIHPLAQITHLRASCDLGSSSQENLQTPLRHWKNVTTGTLSNGFKYTVTPNNTPPGRMQAYLEVHTGSVDEEDHQQGLAHYLEHAVFLGTTKYPTAEKMRAVLAGWGMSFGGDTNAYTDFRNTVYTLQAPVPTEAEHNKNEVWNVLDVLHEMMFNALLLEEHVSSERGAVLSEMICANTVDYRIEYNKFQQLYGHNLLSKRFPIGKEDLLKKYTAQDLREFYTKWYRCDNMTLHVCGSINAQDVIRIITDIFGKEKAPSTPGIRAPVPIVKPTQDVVIFQHELVTQVAFTLNAVYPNQPIVSLEDMIRDTITYLATLVLESRVYNLEQSLSDPPFSGIIWQFFDSFRENSACSSLIVSAHGREWKEAVTMGIIEFQRLYTYGITESELKETLGGLLKDAHSEAEQNDTQKSDDLIEIILDDCNLGNVIMDRRQEYYYLMKAAHSITLSRVNAQIKELLCWVQEFPGQGADHVSVFVSAPLTVDGHKFSISNQEVLDVIKGALLHVEPGKSLDVADQLVTPEEIQAKVGEMNPRWITPEGKKWSPRSPTLEIEHPETGVFLRKLDNGIPVTLKPTHFEAKQCTLRILSCGGRSMEEVKEAGALLIGIRTFLDGGAGRFSSEEINKYCLFHGINLETGVASEGSYIDASCSVSHGGFAKLCEVLHLFLSSPRFDTKAFDRAKKMYLLESDRFLKEVESVTFNKLLSVLTDPPDHRFLIPSKQQYEALTLETCRDIVLRAFSTRNIELTLVGDFEKNQVVETILAYFGSLPAGDWRAPDHHHLNISAKGETIHTLVEDDEERAFMHLGFVCPNRWGKIGDHDLLAKHPNTSRSPVYSSRILLIASMILNNKLFTTIREKMGLTYDISTDVAQYEFYDRGMFFVSLVPFPGEIERTKQEVVKMLHDFKHQKATQEELDEVLVPMVKGLKTSLTTNSYWLNLLAHVQNVNHPKDLSALTQIPQFYETVTLADISFILDHCFLPENLTTSIGVTKVTEKQTDAMET
eukprot:TRINITY_DN2436_c0_g4_i1.p1 TRINITY_DN2436_c0_g4~~TRINITY_DN2436_c0_g4_i1.p1  ORF type:complete len:1034 (-),score=180.46 TRINITY_DN2436_c0_g4_i1:108-3209(-)